jgi:subtilase family serine protease
VWNGFNYHVTDFELQGGWWDVPVNEVPSWTSYNSYRQNVQGGVLFPVPDLTVSLKAITICPGEVHLVAKVTNNGSAGAASMIPVQFYRTDEDADNPPELLGTVDTGEILLPGAWERVSMVYEHTIETEMSFQAVVDEDDLVEECDTQNNAAQAQTDICFVVE